ncbi:hypothetical protein Pla123a_42420 [Posidoniimonas polymericola]|uniref:Right handed beta helix domain-containing protein n=1 Tax=Posidoniimonas polymericola TaxID=2528002 RepID=A0A5C5XWH5_9BACT|nr:hypothetical protein [Posidoniimonas polymericola]TWT67686.1 hypothetical protein Pla123a_42420 [Posidoniimonas polymericola]
MTRMRCLLLLCLLLLPNTLHAGEAAETVAEWVASALSGEPRTLAAGVHVVTEPIVLNSVHSLRLAGPSRTLMDPAGWGRAWWANNLSRACIVCFDLPEGVAGIQMTGCRGIEIRGVNFCRTTPGCLITDSNAEGRNSGDHTFAECGFYRRTHDAKDDIPDLLGGLAMDEQAGHYGLGVYGSNGCDAYTFVDCVFKSLDRGVDLDCPQTTRMIFVRTHWRRCGTMGSFRGSGNIACHSCGRYDSGPLTLEDCPEALTSVAWIGGWLDTSRRKAQESGMQPLVDFSKNPTGRLVLVGGNGRKLGNLAPGVQSPPLVIPPRDRSKLSLQIDGPWSANQALLPPEGGAE